MNLFYNTNIVTTIIVDIIWFRIVYFRMHYGSTSKPEIFKGVSWILFWSRNLLVTISSDKYRICVFFCLYKYPSILPPYLQIISQDLYCLLPLPWTRIFTDFWLVVLVHGKSAGYNKSEESQTCLKFMISTFRVKICVLILIELFLAWFLLERKKSIDILDWHLLGKKKELAILLDYC